MFRILAMNTTMLQIASGIFQKINKSRFTKLISIIFLDKSKVAMRLAIHNMLSNAKTNEIVKLKLFE